ncbi:MAG TPA: alpha/beta hydrolase [Candidatus Polarisedimenticolia bacterium]|nr:alpha/beta hydrolase [Candidatus Polarisedimenticolia bacterium]
MSGKIEDLVLATHRGDAAAPFPWFASGIEECWMDVEGARMRYLRAGSGRALILLHGLLGYSFSWRYAMPALAPYATVYAPDMMGAGFSDRPIGIDHSMRGTAKRLLRFIAELGVTSFDLLGTSHGGAVAMVAAAECLSGNTGLHLRRLVLVAPVNPYSAHGRNLAPFFGTPYGAALFRVAIARMTFLYPFWHARMYGDRRRIPPGALEGYMAPLAKPGLFEHALSIVRTWTRDLRELETALPKLASIPTLLIWGSDDTAVDASSAEPLAKFFPNSKSIIFPGIGHLTYEECPEEFNQALIEFLTDEATLG